MNKLKYTHVFCDVDDTLLNDKREIGTVNLQEIANFTNAGGKFILVTGRNFLATKEIYEELKLKTPVIINQGCVYIPDENIYVYKNPIAKEFLSDVCDFLEKRNIYFQLFFNDLIYVKKKTDYSYEYIKHCGVKFEETHIPLSQFVRETPLCFDKLMIECEESIIENLQEQLEQTFRKNLVVKKSKKWILEIFSPENTKGAALRYVMAETNIKKTDCMAIGDSESDISMFKEVGFAVAVSNSTPEVISNSNAVSTSNNQFGVGIALSKYAYAKNDM